MILYIYKILIRMVTNSESPILPKFSYVGITIPTSNINHTALYKHGETLEDFKSSTFETIYKTPPANAHRVKNLESREHDEVISRVIKAMGLSLQFVEFRGSRYVNIWAKFRTTTPEEREKIVETLNTIIRKFRRKPEPPKEEIVPVIFTDVKKTGNVLMEY